MNASPDRIYKKSWELTYLFFSYSGLISFHRMEATHGAPYSVLHSIYGFCETLKNKANINMFGNSSGLSTGNLPLKKLDSCDKQALKEAKGCGTKKSLSADRPSSYGDKCLDLYTETDEMLESLVLFSSLVVLRKCLIRPRCDAPVVDRIAHVPVSHAEIMNSLAKNQSKLQKRIFGCENPLKLTKYRPRVTATTILHASVNNRTQSRFNFSVSVNHQRKKVIVCFQDSSLHLENWETRLIQVSNPFQSRDPSVSDYVHVHEGLLNLIGCSLNPWSEFNRFMIEYISPTLKQHQRYRLFVTGFKNGAGLATIFALYAASTINDEVPTPVSLFSFGSPYVGDQSFRELHQHLEKMGRLRHLRIANFMDYTPLTPQVSLHFDVFTPMFFKHVGMQLTLYDGLFPPEVSYPRTDGGFIGNAADELQRGWKQSIFSTIPLNPLEWPDHGLEDYVDQMFLNKPLLQGLDLDQLYSRYNIRKTIP